MRLSIFTSGLSYLGASIVRSQAPVLVTNEDCGVSWKGFERNGVEVFLNIKYGEDTGGQNRFKPPRPFHLIPGTTYDATQSGPACPQVLGTWNQPLTLLNTTSISEDCLNLNLVKPKGNFKKPLPVMVWIHGGSFWVGSNMEPTHMPDALILEAADNGTPVIHVAMNYRLGFFGFAQSDALKKEGSANAGLRDQRLAMEWVRENVANFGGDPENITIFGQSSGGLAVGMHLMAYGGTKPLPFQRGICQSQALEPGITGNFTIDAMTNLVNYVGCNDSSVHSSTTIECLRKFGTQELFDASFATYIGDIKHNIGDVWLPTVDDDFLPAPPSQLLKERRFGNATYMIGWTNDDVNFFTDFSIATPEDTSNFIHNYLPALPIPMVEELLALYPAQEFTPPTSTNLTAEFYRAARVFRDVLMVCQPIYLAEAIHAKWNGTMASNVFLYNWNQTLLDPILKSVYNVSNMGAVHTSEFAYMYGNFSHYNQPDWPFAPSIWDEKIRRAGSRSWSSFATSGNPSQNASFPGWLPAFSTGHLQPSSAPNDPLGLYLVGEEWLGWTPIDGPQAVDIVSRQRLRERCGLINSERFLQYMQF